MPTTKLETNTEKPALSFYENEMSNELISVETENKLDKCIDNIVNYMKNNSGLGQSEQTKDILYADSQILWKEYQTELRNVKYNFHLNRRQYNYLYDLLKNKMEYDVNTVFIAIGIKDMLETMKNTMNFKNDVDLLIIPVNATEITYVYHLIATHKVKGLTKDSITFSEILIRIGEISKILSYYDAHAKSLTKDIADWAASFDDPNAPLIIEEEKIEMETIEFNSESNSIEETKSEKKTKKTKKEKAI